MTACEKYGIKFWIMHDSGKGDENAIYDIRYAGVERRNAVLVARSSENLRMEKGRPDA